MGTMGFARTGCAQELKAVGSRAAALPLAFTTHWGNDKPHGGKGINRLGLGEDPHC